MYRHLRFTLLVIVCLVAPVIAHVCVHNGEACPLFNKVECKNCAPCKCTKCECP